MSEFFAKLLRSVMNDDYVVFLGGTCNGSKWREKLVESLYIKAFNPVVKEWTEEARINEENIKAQVPILLYVITPNQHGFYSIAEMIVSALNETNKQTIICFLDNDDGEMFTEEQKKSNKNIETLLNTYVATYFYYSLEEVANHINSYKKET